MPEHSGNNFSQYMKMDSFETTKFISGTQTLTSQNMRMALLKKTLISTLDVILFKKKLHYNNWYEAIQKILFANGIELLVQWTPYQNFETVFKYN